MSECSKDKTKRKFIDLLLNHEWDFQVSIFYRSYEDALNIIHDSRIIRKDIVKEFPNRPFLWRLCVQLIGTELLSDLPPELKNSKRIALPYHTFFTSGYLPRSDYLKHLEQNLLLPDLAARSRTITREKLQSYAQKVRDQEPHNLKRFITGENYKRYIPLGKKYLIPYEGEINHP